MKLSKIYQKFIRFTDNVKISVMLRCTYNRALRKRIASFNKDKSIERVKVCFLVYSSSVWKYQVLLSNLENDPNFECHVIIIPLLDNNGDVQWGVYDECVEYFEGSLSTVHKCIDGHWVDLNEILPNIVFYSDCWNISLDKYYQPVFTNYISCYVPYSHQVSYYDDYKSQYNQLFHNCMWKIFTPHKYEFEIFKNHSIMQGKNTLYTGYSDCSQIQLCRDNNNNIRGKKLIIWAPHHSVNWVERRYSNFLEMFDFMQKITIQFKDDVDFVFKPHPMLKEVLKARSDWGNNRTAEYYKWWAEQSNTSIVEGSYIDLFNDSTAIIHDSGSFLAEYLYTGKPCYFVLSDEKIVESFNEFGKLCLEHYYKSTDIKEIENFILKVCIEQKDEMKGERMAFIEKELSDSLKASQKIKECLLELM